MTVVKIPEGLTGHQILSDNLFNKGSAFSPAERKALKLDGLLPPVVYTIEEQETRIMENYHKKSSDIDKYVYLMSLLDHNITRLNSVML